MARLVKKPLRAVGLGAVALCLAAGGYLLLRDEPPPYDADLMPVRRSVPDGDNGFFDLPSKEDVVDDSLQVMNKVDVSSLSEEAALRLAAEIQEKNAEAFRRLDAALGKPHFQFPEGESPHYEWTALARSLASCSRLEARGGRVKSAFDRALKLIRLGSRVQRASNDLGPYFHSCIFLQWGVGEVIAMVCDGRLTAEELWECLGTLEAVPDPHEDLRAAMLGEYQDFKVLADSFYRGTDILPWFKSGLRALAYRRPFLKPNSLKRQAAEDTRRMRDLACYPPRARQGLSSRPETWLRFSWDHLALEGVWVGGSQDNILGCADRIACWVAAGRALAALALYRESHARLPESLGELVPEYLGEIPRDPYDGNPLRYLPEEGTVYAIGEDLADRGGSREEDAQRARWDGAEPTFRIDG
jgi:hypothetical protein